MKVEEIAVRAIRSPSKPKTCYKPAADELSADEIALKHRHSQLPKIRATMIRAELKKVIDNFALDEAEALDALITAFSGYTRKFVDGKASEASKNRNYSHRRSRKA